MAKTKRKKKPARRPVAYVPIPLAFFKATTMSRAYLTAEDIVQEIINEMNLTVASVGKAFQTATSTTQTDAIAEWRDKLKTAVFLKLAKPGSNWTADRPNVLQVARDMAVISALLSGAMAQISKPRIHAAFRACKDHQTCPNLAGSGAWCNFDA